ncbi:BglG family transcription antiterminator [Vagococcus carniphilus]|uniref:BglG family transcription antiterminator n=1 Tax=Vagococcus carniphilus TaxID=218144 RepID=UPI003BAA6CC2
MLKKRQKELLELLESQNDFLTVHSISSQLGVSKRTIHSDLKLLEDYIPSLGKYLEKKRGVGIALRDLKENTSLKRDNEVIDAFSVMTRRIEIMKLLLFEEAEISFNFLSEKFMVSKTSIMNDFEFIMEIFKAGSNVELKSGISGTKIVGSEIDRQKAFLQFNRYILSNSDLYREDIISKKMSLLEPYYGKKIVSVCNNILYSYVRENINAISDYYIQNILNIFIILVYRSLNGKHISKNKVEKYSKNQKFYKKSAIKLLSKVGYRLDISFTKEDTEYFSQHLVSNRFEVFPEDSIDDSLVEELLTKVSKALNIDFSEDKKLEEQLKKHIPPMIYRLQTCNKTDNPFTEQVKVEFSLTFNVIWVVLSEYENELGIKFNEDEIAFLTIYFQSAIERAKINRKILIICQMGIATSELLLNRIKNIVPSLDSIEVASVGELEFIDLNKVDLIISTVKIEIPQKKVVFVSPFLTDIDIKNIENLNYAAKKLPKTDNLSNIVHLRKFVQPDFIYTDTDFVTKEELFTTISNDLMEYDFVTQEFITSIVNREKLGGTDLPTGIAVPHGNPTDVKKTVIAIIKNNKKFKWDKYYVDVIFLIGISKEDTQETRNILSDIYKIIDDPQMLKNLRSNLVNNTIFEELRREKNG